MKRLCFLALVTGFFSACTPPPFTPQTLEGARCKLTASIAPQSCPSVSHMPMP